VDSWELEFYTTAGGTAPVVEYIDALSEEDAARVVRSLELLEALGLQLTEPHVKKIPGKGLWELRTVGKTHHRVFYVAIQGRRFLLLHGFLKKSQKTPPKEIQTALQRLSDYQKRLKP
jgi:phage-related protein